MNHSHVLLYVEDAQRALNFYVRKLGLLVII